MKRVLAVFLTVVMIIVSVVVCPASSTYAAEFDGLKDGINYKIVSKSSGMAMTVSGFSTENSAGICQMPIGNYKSQIWTLEDMGDGYCRIVNKLSGKALNVPNNVKEADTQIIQYNKENGDNSKWKLTKTNGNYYRITSKHVESDNFALRVKDNSTERSAAIVQNTYTGADNELWEFIPINEDGISDYPQVDAQLAVDSFLGKFVYQENGVYKLKRCGTIWSASESIEVMLDIYERYGGDEYKEMVCGLVDWYIQNNGEHWENNDFNDDVMWAVIMCARTYLLTGEEKYLTYAENNFEMCYNRAWSEDLGGGLWWTTDNDTKNACVNGPGAVAACLIGEATGDETYFTKAKAIIDWEIKTLLADDGGVWDSYNAKQEYNKWVSSYNQGTFIGACTMLYQHYNEQNYYDCAKKAMDRSTKLNLNGEQTGNDLIGFKGILARWMRYFAANCNVDDYNEWMYRGAASAWVNRNSDNLMWTQFGTVTEENIDTFVAKDTNGDGVKEDENKEKYAGWGCSSALSWLVNCTDIDARQEKEQSRTESLGMTAAKTAYNKTLAEAKVVYEAGSVEYLASSWNVFVAAYNAALNLKADPTIAEIREVQSALYAAYSGLKMKNPPGTIIEMESGERSSVARVVSAANCSGGKYVGEMGGEKNGAVTFIVTTDRAGDHLISVKYCTAGDRKLNIKVNGTDNPVTCKGSSWDTPAANPAEVTVYMEKGENTIVFEGVANDKEEIAYAPNVDCFTFTRTNSEANQQIDAEEGKLVEEALKTILEESKKLYEAGQSNYTADSWNTFKVAYEKALNPPANSTVEDLTKMKEDLEKAKGGLEENSEPDDEVILENAIEIESGVRSEATELVESAACSGGKYVGNIGGQNNGMVTFEVEADKPGYYIILVKYCTWEDRRLNIQVNGTDYPVMCIGTEDWNTPASNPVEETIYLNKGENTIVFAGVEGADAPNLDCFAYQRIDSEENQKIEEAEIALTGTLNESESVYTVGQSNYTDDSWNAFKSAYENAMNPPVNASAEDFNKLKELLVAAQNNLEEKSGLGDGNTGTDVDNGNGGNAGMDVDNGNSGNNDTIGEGGTGSGNENKETVSNEIVKGSSVEQATQVITSNKTDGNLAGSTFAALSLRVAKATNNTQKLRWNKVKDADGYIIFSNKCGKQLKLLKTIKKGTITSWTCKNLKKNTYYKYVILAYKVTDGEKITLSTSKTIHVLTTGGKYSDIKSVKVKQTKVTLKKGKTFKIKAQEVKTKTKLKLKRHRKIYFESTNTKVAIVSKQGRITAKKKGTCYVYAYAQNGVFKKIKVKVK